MLRYKYLPIDKSFDFPYEEKGSLSVITDGTIKFSHAEDFNDPFDCYPEVNTKKISESFSENKAFFKRVANEKGLSPAKRILEKPKQMKLLESTLFSNPSEILNNQIGVCCLSRDPTNLLMWAHYASSHRGFIVEFSIPCNKNFTPMEDLIHLLAFPIEYKKEKPIIENTKSFRKHFLTKGLDWTYEKEERVIDQYRGCGIHPYDRKNILKSVIAGIKMSEEHFSILRNSVNNMNQQLGINVNVLRAKAVKGKFSLSISSDNN